MRRSAWTDARIDEKMTGIDSTFEMLRDEMQGLRADNREQSTSLQQELRDLRGDVGDLRGEMRDLRGDFFSLQGRLVQIGFGLVGTLLAAMIALIVALA